MIMAGLPSWATAEPVLTSALVPSDRSQIRPRRLRRDGISAATPSDERYGPAPDRLPFERGTDGPRVIVVGIDGSPTSMRAASYACGLARRQRGHLVVFFWTPP